MGERQTLYLPELFAHANRARVKSASNKAFAFSLATMHKLLSLNREYNIFTCGFSFWGQTHKTITLKK